MKKKALHKDIYMTVRRTLPRFLSIFFIVILGVAFYSGIRVTEKDMKITADTQFDRTNLMDIKLLGSRGLSEENLQAVKNLSSVSDAEGSYSLDTICRMEGSNDEYVTKVLAKTERMNQFEITSGRMPEKENECLVDENFAKDHHLKNGEKLILSSGTEEPLNELLTEDHYVITGIGKSLAYLSRERGTTEIGIGKVNGFLVISPKNFKQDVYSEIYISVKNAKKELAYTEEYDRVVKKTEKQIENIEKEQNLIRLKQIQGEALKEIAKKESEYKGEKRKAQKKLKKAEEKLKKAEKEINAAKVKLVQNEEKLKQGKNELKAGWDSYYSGKRKLSLGRKKLSESEKKLKEQEKQLSDNELSIKQQEESLNQLEKQIEEYEQSLGADHPQVQSMKQKLSEGRKTLEAATKQIVDGKRKILSGKQKLVSTRKELEENEKTLKRAKSTLESKEKELNNASLQLEKGKEQLKRSERQLKDGKKELKASETKVQKKLNEGQKKLDDAKEDIKNIKAGEWYVLNRKKTQSYVEYGEDTARIGAIGEVVPAIFFLVAALVSLTTMTRMVEEQRTQIGVLKALGYTGWDIALKYVSYGLVATFSGSIIGAVAGEKILPKIIIEAYSMMYIGLGDIKTPLESQYSIIASGLAVGVVILAVLSACYKELKEKPAQLMRPEAPKEGKRIILEYIGVLWKRMSFTWKATIRNLFRYKKRFFMTVFGIGGCMSLLLVGFGLMDSIFAVSDNQYRKITTYDIAVSLKENISNKEAKDFDYWLDEQQKIKEKLKVYETSVSIEADGNSKTASLIVPLSMDHFSDFFLLKDRKSGKRYDLDDEGIIITEKAATLLGVEKGDIVSVKTDEINQVSVKVVEITENYMYHNIYMTPGLYQKKYHKIPKATKIYLNTKRTSETGQKQIGRAILNEKAAASVMFASDAIRTMEDMIGNLNIVMIVLIVSAGLLAVVVLYNLNNINISERRAELATLKVLGFYDIEVGAYVYRENILLTIIGIITGVGLGKILHRYVILTVEVDLLMFGRDIFTMSYVYSILLTVVFSIIINFLMYFQLKKINMVESLKSTE